MRRRIQIALFAAGCGVGVCQLVYLAPTGYHGSEMATIAINLVEQGVYGNPFPPALTGPTACVPPFYPLILATLLKLFGSLSWMMMAATAINILANACIATLLPHVSEVFFKDWKPGAFAGALWICAMRLMPEWDASCTIAALMVFCLLTARTIGSPQAIARRAAVAGALAAVLVLLNPATLTIFLPWVAFLLWRRAAGFRYALQYGGILLLALGLGISPWIVRNYRVWHTPVLRTNFGMTLYCSNNSCAESSLTKAIANGCYQATHPVRSLTEVALLKRLGEVRYDQNRVSAALTWIRSNPGRFRDLTLARIVEFWFPDLQASSYTAYVIWLITALSIPGILLMARHRMPVTLFVLAVWLVSPLMYYIVVSCDRYRYPILWTSLLPAGYFLASVLKRPLAPALPLGPSIE